MVENFDRFSSYSSYLRQQRTFNDNGAITTLDHTSKDVIELRDAKSGSRNADWRARIAAGIDASSAYTRIHGYITRHVPCDARTTLRRLAPPGLIDDHISGKFTPNFQFSNWEPDTSESDDQALMRWVSKARSELTAFQGGVFAGELAETLHLIRHPADALRKGINDYLRDLRRLSKQSKFRRSTAKAKRKAIAGTWLEYAFGITPLIHDTQDAAEAIAKQVMGRREVKRVRASASGNTLNGPFDGVRIVGAFVLKTKDTYIDTFRVGYYGAVKCELNTVGGFAQNFGFDPSSFVPTLYELIPYSFLVDYFSNVGKILDAFSFPSSSLAWLGYTKHTDTHYHMQSDISVQTSGGFEKLNEEIKPGSLQIRMSRYSRTPLSSVPIPSLRFRVPGFSRDWNKWANISALVAQSASISRSIT